MSSAMEDEVWFNSRSTAAFAFLITFFCISAYGADPVTFTFNGPVFVKGPDVGKPCTVGEPFCIIGNPMELEVFKAQLTTPGGGNPNWTLRIETNYGVPLPGNPNVIPPYYSATVGGDPNIGFPMGDFLIEWKGTKYGIALTPHDGYTAGYLYSVPSYLNSTQVLSTQANTNVFNPDHNVLLGPGGTQLGTGTLTAGSNGGDGVSSALYYVTVSFSAPAGFLVGSPFTIDYSSYACANAIVMGSNELVVNPPSLTKAFALRTLNVSQVTTMTLTVTNPNPAYDLTNVVVSDPLPSPLQIPNPDGRGGTCLNLPGVSLQVTAGPPPSLTLTIPTLAAGTSCTLTLNLLGTAVTTGTCTIQPPPSGLGTTASTNTATVTSDSGAGVDAKDCITITQINPPVLGKLFALHSVNVNQNTSMTFTVSNPNTQNIADVVVQDTLPVPLQIPNPSGAGGTCLAAPYSGSLNATAAGFTLTIPTFPGLGLCTLTLNVVGTAPTTGGCTITPPPAGLGTTAAENTATVTSTTTGPGLPARDCITVPPIPPSLSKQFFPNPVAPNEKSQLSFQLCNPNTNIGLDGVNFTDTLLNPLAVASPNNLKNGNPVSYPSTPACAGSITAVAGTNVISVSGVSLAQGACCGFQVDVVSPSEGTFPNNTTNITSTSPLLTGNIGTDTLRVRIPAPPVTDVYQVSYAANLDIGDSYVNVTNAGTRDGRDPAGTICVNVFVFDPAEEPVSCCTCPVTPNGLKSLSVQSDLISNPLTPSVPTAVVIKLVASVPVNGSCNASSVNRDNLVRGMRAWRTTLHQGPATPPAWDTTEVPFSISDLSDSELNKLRAVCGFMQSYGSGYGICRSCRAGAMGGEKLP